MVFPRIALASLVAVTVASAACSRGTAKQAGSAAPPAGSPAAASGAVVAEVNGTAILQGEVDQRAANRLAQVRQQEYEIRKQALDEIIGEKLLDAEAAKKGISRDELVRREVETKAQVTPQATIDAIYEQNKARFGAAPKEQAVARIREILGERAQAERRAAYAKELRSAARVAVRLEPPRVTVTVPANAPSNGPADAPVSIVEFTDYQCPFCHRAQTVIEQVLAKYPGKVRLVHLDFPLDGHPGAFPAARAARCAAEQGRWWEYHRDLMTSPGSLDDADLKARAGKLGLKPADFGGCVASTRHDEAIRGSFQQGEQLGVTGTPAYFVNGRALSGARPLEDFAELVDAELAAR